MSSMTYGDMESILFLWNPGTVLIRVRWSIFITISVCAGLPALVWSASDIIQHRRNGHRISAFIILLLITDCIELLLSPYIIIKLHLNELCLNGDWTCGVLIFLYSSSRVGGLLLNQHVALEGNLSVKYPLYTAWFLSSKLFITFYIIVFLYITIACIFNDYMLAVFGYIMPVIVWILSCFAPCCSDRHSHTSRKTDPHIWVIFIFTVLVLYLPWILLIFRLLFPPSAGLILHVCHISFFLMNTRLISDPLLSVLVCRTDAGRPLLLETAAPDHLHTRGTL